MNLVFIIKNVLRALTAYLELKNKMFYYDIIEKSRNRQKDIIDEIEKLRSKGTNADSDRADLLRAELIKERDVIKHLSAFYSLSGEG